MLAPVRPRSCHLAGRAVACALLLVELAEGRPRRARFEPTDLDLEKPGLLEVDAQVGVTNGDGDAGDRLVLPDFEVDLGLTSNVEINIDGAFSLDHFDRSERSMEGEALWTAVKLGLADFRDPESDTGFAIGAQLGPRIPTIGAKGIGYGALGLFGFKSKQMHATANLGYLLDPGPRILGSHSKSAVAGIDFEVDLDAKSTWSLMAALAAAYYQTHEPTELTLAAGAAVDLSKAWTLNWMVLGGILPGEDRLALLFGATPRFYLW